MPARKPDPPAEANDPTEYQRFVEIARELGVDESPGALDRAFEKVIPTSRREAAGELRQTRPASNTPPQHRPVRRKATDL